MQLNIRSVPNVVIVPREQFPRLPSSEPEYLMTLLPCLDFCGIFKHIYWTLDEISASDGDLLFVAD